MTICCLLAALVLPLTKGGEAHTGMFRSGNGGIAERFADASVTWTDEGLAIRVRRRLKDGERAKSVGRPDDPASIFGAGGGSTVEVLIAPHADAPEVFYQFAADPSNILYQARLFDTTWRPARPVTSRTFVGTDEWGAVFMIPFGAFGEKPVSEGSEWRADIGCGNADWAGVQTRHDPGAYGIFRFGTEPQRAYVESVARGSDGLFRVTFAVRPGEGGREIPHKALESSSLELCANGSAVADFRLAEEGGDPDYLSLDRYYYRPDDVLVYAARGFGGCCTVSVRRIDTGVVLRSVTAAGAGRLATGRLEPGDYAFCISGGGRSTSCQFEVLDDGERASEPAVDGTLRIRPGAPTVLEADFGERTSVPYYPITGSQALRGGIGIRGILGLRYVRKPTAGYMVDPDRLFDAAAAVLKDGPGAGLTLNRLAYEAQIKVLTADAGGRLTPVPSQGAFFLDAYRTLKARFPRSLFSLQTDSASAVAELAPACDVLEFAGSGAYGANPLLQIRRALDIARNAAPDKPVVIWLGGALPDRAAHRSADELNSAVRYCVLRGMAGNVFHMGHGGVPDAKVRLWSFLRGAERATNAWYPAWAKGVAADLDVSCGEKVSVGARKTAGGTVLVGVNLDPHEQGFSFSDPVSGSRRVVLLTGFGSVVMRLPSEGHGESAGLGSDFLK